MRANDHSLEGTEPLLECWVTSEGPSERFLPTPLDRPSRDDQEATSQGPRKRESEKVLVEFHFVEFFSNDRIDISVGDEVRSQVVATTKFQTGLAHIERLELHDGEKVSLRIEESNLETTLKVDINAPFIIVRLTDRQLRAEAAPTSPGYL